MTFIGERDNYFSADPGSLAAQVADDPNGYGGPITGNCRAPLDAQGFTQGVVTVFPEIKHSLIYTHDNAMRSIVSDFLANPTSPAAEWKSLNRPGCVLEGGVYQCDGLNDPPDEPPCSKYVNNPAVPWADIGA